MLIKTISFEIHNFETNVSEKFLVNDTLENQEMIFCHRYTRNIQFAEMFKFQFEKEMSMPLEMIHEDTWRLMVTANPALLAGVAALETV